MCGLQGLTEQMGLPHACRPWSAGQNRTTTGKLGTYRASVSAMYCHPISEIVTKSSTPNSSAGTLWTEYVVPLAEGH